MRLHRLLVLLLVIPAHAEPAAVIAVYSPNFPVSGLVASLNDTYVVEVVENLTEARSADILIVMAPTNVSQREISAIRRTLKSGGLVILTSEPRNSSIRDSVNDILDGLGLPTLVYDDVIYDFMRNDGSPRHPKADGLIIYSSSLVNRTDAIRRNSTFDSAVAISGESVRESGKLVRSEAIRRLSGELVLIGGTSMFSDEIYSGNTTRFDLNGRYISRIISEFLSERSSSKSPRLPLISERILYAAIALLVLAFLKTIKYGRR